MSINANSDFFLNESQSVDLPELAERDIEPLQEAEVIELHRELVGLRIVDEGRSRQVMPSPPATMVGGYRAFRFEPAAVAGARRIVLDLAFVHFDEREFKRLVRESSIYVLIVQAGDNVPWFGRFLYYDEHGWPYRMVTETCEHLTARDRRACVDEVHLTIGNTRFILPLCP